MKRPTSTRRKRKTLSQPVTRNPTLKEQTAARVAKDFVDPSLSVRHIFERLLWTWPLNLEHSRGLDSLLNGVHSRDELEKRYHELEKQYGDRNAHHQLTYDDRRLLLQATIARLKRHAEEHGKPDLLQTTFMILLQAREKASAASLARFKLLSDRERRIKPDQRTSRRLVEALQERKAHLEQYEPNWIPSECTQHLTLINELLKMERKDNEGVLPKLSQGRKQTAPVANWARQALIAAKVPRGLRDFHQDLARVECIKRPKNLHDAFLMAVGVIAYGSPRPSVR